MALPWNDRGHHEAGLEIAQNGVDPAKHRQILGFACPDDDRLVGATDVGDAGEAGQASGDPGAGRGEARTRSRGDGGSGEAGHRGELGAHRMTLVVERDRADEGHLALRDPALSAADELAAKVGVVDLHGPAQHRSRGGLALDHRLNQLVVDQPSGRIEVPPRPRFNAKAESPVFSSPVTKPRYGHHRGCQPSFAPPG